MAVLSTVVGLAGGFGVIGFRSLVDWIQALSYGAGGDLLTLAQAAPWYAKVCIPGAGGLAVGLLLRFATGDSRGQGVPEVMEAVAIRRGIMGMRSVLVKSVASAMTIGSGGSAGIQGPTVHIGAGLGSVIGQVLRVSGDRIRTLACCGAAAGIAATFNAPIAGAMFALEVILGEFGIATFSPIVISSVTATAVSRHFLGNTPVFTLPSYQLLGAIELPLYVILGFLCAGVAVLFTTTLYRMEAIFSGLKCPAHFKAMLGGLGVGGIALLFPHVLGVGFPTIDHSLISGYSWSFMLFLLAAKVLATSLTIGSGRVGGVFFPSLFLGAMTGSVFGTIVHALMPGMTASAGAYGMVAMGAVVSGTTHGPMSAILILFEMTGNYRIILPLMIACIISTVVARQWLEESIYTLNLSRKGVNLKAGREINLLASIPVTEAMNSAVESVPENLSLGRFAEKISTSKYNSFPVVNEEGFLTGVISYLDYHDAMLDENLANLVVVKELATQNVVTISIDENLYTALQKIASKDFSILPVVDPEDPGKILGVLNRRDIMSAYNKAVIMKAVLKEQ